MCKKPTRRKLFQSSPVERGKRGAGERRRKEQIDNGKKGEGAPPSLLLSSLFRVLCSSTCESWRLARSSEAGGLFRGSGGGVVGGWLVGWAVGWKERLQGVSLSCIQDGVGASGKNCKPAASMAEGTHCGAEH